MKRKSTHSELVGVSLKILGILLAFSITDPAFAQEEPSDNPGNYNNSIIVEQVSPGSQSNKMYLLQEGTELDAAIIQDGSNNEFWGYQRGNDGVDYTVTQTGNYNRVGKYLGGEEFGLHSSASSRGDRNAFTVTQTGEGNFLNHVDQRGDDNSIVLTQEGDYHRVSGIIQNGSENTVSITQIDGGASQANKVGVVTQDGSQNSITISQSGIDNVITDVTQAEGPGNEMVLEQSGTSNRIKARNDRPEGTAGAEQLGSYNRAFVIQTGNRNETEVHQKGDHNYQKVEQTGNDNVARIGTGDPSNDFGQSGDNNVAKIYQVSNNNFANIHNQDGDESLILIRQEGRGGHVARVRTFE